MLTLGGRKLDIENNSVCNNKICYCIIYNLSWSFTDPLWLWWKWRMPQRAV